ncbi:MAG: hypothetical protein Kow0075_06960 [Salibacteraceae bacterium]
MFDEAELPEEFFDSESHEPISSCLVCGVNFNQAGCDYFIEKVFRRVESLDLTETMYEYALCVNCAEAKRNELSRESMQRIQEFVESRFRRIDLNADPTERIKKCIVTGKPVKDDTEYTIQAYCRNGKLLSGVFPFAISGEAMDEMEGLLSEKTRDELDRFRDAYFGGPPEMREFFKKRRIIPI